MTDRRQTRLGNSSSELSMKKVRRLSPEDLGLAVPEEEPEAVSEQEYWETLRDAASEARKYSSDEVPDAGCAVLSAENEIWSAVSVLTGDEQVHGLRLAVLKAVSEGASSIKKVVVVSEMEVGLCGRCLQVLYEFGGEAVDVRLVSDDVVEEYVLGELYPHPWKDSYE